MEEHNGEKGVVWFEDAETLKAYRKAIGLDDEPLFTWNMAAADPLLLVPASTHWWGCNCVYFVRREGEAFVRDVTGFVDDGKATLSNRSK